MAPDLKPAPACRTARPPLLGSLLDAALRSHQLSKIVKFAHRLWFGRHYRHSIDIWPYLAIRRDDRDNIVEISINRRALAVVPASAIPRASHAKSRLHLVATGPSVNEIDYSRIEPAPLIGVNGAITLKARFSLEFDYYVIIDYTFITEQPDIALDVINQENTLLFTTPKCLVYIHKLLGIEKLKCKLCVIELVAEKYNEDSDKALSAAKRNPELVLEADPTIGFSHRIENGFFRGGTVAYVALQIAAYLDYHHIYLHGIDIHNAETHPRFYETMENRKKTQLVNEFDGTIKPSFQLASKLLQQRDIEVLNLSRTSSLSEQIFEKVDVKQIYIS
ncbi:hypothetical protein [Paludibacterium yongneupense]|uniref:hypothetical protein n=1 Tax=Paludibacterium yongneupense TaxID=400061 RepID=UPI0003FC6820|nr:hypothetical protein [Paludibacterium yongneupense]